MKIESAEKSLCLLYVKSLKNQKIDINYSNKKDSFKDRLKNLKKQFQPYDMEELCKKNGIKTK
jgi:hypothetical protein